MKMKNVLMILISLAVVFAMVGVVSGEMTPSKKTDTMIVKYDVTDSYIIHVPAAVTILDNLESTNNLVNATSVLINSTKLLNVSLTSNNWWQEKGIYNLTIHGSNIPYYINMTTSDNEGPTPVANETVILSVAAGHEHPILKEFKTGTASIGDYVNLTFQTTLNFISYATKSGSHQDTLTFTCEVVDTPSTP